MLLNIAIFSILALSLASGRPENGRIVNGTSAEESAFPFIASIQNDEFHICGGSIIHSSWILTAAHCVEDEEASQLEVWYNVTNFASNDQLVADVSDIICHENYAPEKNFANDIALLKLKRPIYFGHLLAAPILLPEHNFEVPEHANAQLMGWGQNETGGIYPDHLQVVDLKVYTDKECIARHRGKTNADQLCGGVDGGGKGQCNGDSGGPLVLKLRNNSIQVGIVSSSIKPCGKAPGVFTKTSHYIPWIKKFAK